MFADFSKALNSIHRGKMEQILVAYGTAIMMLYRNMKVKVCLLDGDTDFFDIVAGVLQGDTFALYLFIICLDYILQTLIDVIKENSFTLKKAKSRRYPAKTIKDSDYAGDIVWFGCLGFMAYQPL